MSKKCQSCDISLYSLCLKQFTPISLIFTCFVCPNTTSQSNRLPDMEVFLDFHIWKFFFVFPSLKLPFLEVFIDSYENSFWIKSFSLKTAENFTLMIFKKPYQRRKNWYLLRFLDKLIEKRSNFYKLFLFFMSFVNVFLNADKSEKIGQKVSENSQNWRQKWKKLPDMEV